MPWILLSILAASFWSLGAFIDNYQTDVIFRGKTPQAVKLANGPIYIIISIIIAIAFQIKFPELWQTMLLILSGVISSIGTFAYYQALKNEEPTGAAIFYQLQPIIIFVVDLLLFHEHITVEQAIGFIAILLAPAFVIFSQKRSKARQMEVSAAIMLVIYVIIATISAEIFTRVGNGLEFTSIIPLYLFGRGLADCFAAISPSIRKRHKYAVKRYKVKYIGSAIINSVLCSSADFCYRSALIIGIAALSSAITNAAELIITFIFGIIFSIFWPKFGREKLQKRIIIGHIIAVILCVIGIFIIK